VDEQIGRLHRGAPFSQRALWRYPRCGERRERVTDGRTSVLATATVVRPVQRASHTRLEEQAMTDVTQPQGDTREQTAPVADAPAQPTPPAEKPKRGRSRKGSGGFELVLTVRGSEDALDWSADVTQAGKKVVTGLPV